MHTNYDGIVEILRAYLNKVLMLLPIYNAVSRPIEVEARLQPSELQQKSLGVFDPDGIIAAEDATLQQG